MKQGHIFAIFSLNLVMSLPIVDSYLLLFLWLHVRPSSRSTQCLDPRCSCVVVNWCLAPNFILGHKRVTEPMENTPFTSTSAQDCCISCYATPSNSCHLRLYGCALYLCLECIAFDFNADSGDCSLSESEGEISKVDGSSTGLVCVN